MTDAQAASFQALQDQLHSFQNEMAAAAHLRTQLVDKDRQIDTIRSDILCVPSGFRPHAYRHLVPGFWLQVQDMQTFCACLLVSDSRRTDMLSLPSGFRSQAYRHVVLIWLQIPGIQNAKRREGTV